MNNIRKKGLFLVLSITVLCILGANFYNKNSNSKFIFDKTYLINLDRRPDRLERFMRTYDESDMSDVPIQRIRAVDGSELDMSKVPLSDIARGELKQDPEQWKIKQNWGQK